MFLERVVDKDIIRVIDEALERGNKDFTIGAHPLNGDIEFFDFNRFTPAAEKIEALIKHLELMALLKREKKELVFVELNKRGK